MPTYEVMTKYETLYELCGKLPEQYVGQSRARLQPAVERMTLLEADDRLDLRLVQHGLLGSAGDSL